MPDMTKTREINRRLDDIAPYPERTAAATAPVLARYLAKQALVTSERATAIGGDPAVAEVRALVAEFAAAHALLALAQADPAWADRVAGEIYGAWEDGEGVHWLTWQHLGDDAEQVALLARELAGLAKAGDVTA